MSSASYGKALSALMGTWSLAAIGWAYHAGEVQIAIVACFAGISLFSAAWEYGMVVSRKVCPICSAHVRKDFMALMADEIQERCKACAGEAHKYPWWTRNKPETGDVPIFSGTRKRGCEKCLRFTYTKFLKSNPTGQLPGWICKDEKACERRRLHLTAKAGRYRRRHPVASRANPRLPQSPKRGP